MRQVDDWLSRWQTGRTGFHQSAADRNLRLLWPSVACPAEARVFVPLCGKSVDISWLRSQGHHVVGLDISPVALESFLLETGIAARRAAFPCFQKFVADRLELLCGDFFSVDEMAVAPVDAVWDRAAFGAMAPRYREPYVASLKATCRPGTRILLSVLEYPEQQTDGPPFPISTEEILRRFGTAFSVTELSRTDILATDERMRRRGVTSLDEVAYLLERRC